MNFKSISKVLRQPYRWKQVEHTLRVFSNNPDRRLRQSGDENDEYSQLINSYKDTHGQDWFFVGTYHYTSPGIIAPFTQKMTYIGSDKEDSISTRHFSEIIRAPLTEHHEVSILRSSLRGNRQLLRDRDSESRKTALINGSIAGTVGVCIGCCAGAVFSRTAGYYGAVVGSVIGISAGLLSGISQNLALDAAEATDITIEGILSTWEEYNKPQASLQGALIDSYIKDLDDLANIDRNLERSTDRSIEMIVFSAFIEEARQTEAYFNMVFRGVTDAMPNLHADTQSKSFAFNWLDTDPQEIVSSDQFYRDFI